MTDDIAGERVPLRNQFPSLRIFEAAGAALSPVSIVIATVTAVLLGLAGWFVDRIIQDNSSIRSTSVFGTVFGLEYSVNDVIACPWSSVAKPAITALTPDSELSVRLNGLIRFALALGTWSLVGVVLCRRSAFSLNGNDESTMQLAVVYGMRRWGATVRSPLIPLAAALLIWLIVAAFGLLGRLPAWGSLWLFIISPVAAITGFAMAFLLLATMLSWPLMVAAVSIDDCESFGGLSRAYSILTGRPWQAIAYLLLSLLVATVLMTLATIVGETTIWCGMSATAFGSGDEPVHRALYSPLSKIVHEFVIGVGASYFWSAATVIYLLLRQDLDGVPLDRISPDDNARPVRDPLPVVGIPATDAEKEQNGEILAMNDRDN